MKKLLLLVAMFGLFFYTIPTQAQEAPKQTIKQRILQIRLAKLRAKKVVVNTGSINTGLILCNTIPITTSFTGTSKEIYEKARDHLYSIEKTLYKLQRDDNCGQRYIEFKKLYTDNISYIIKVRDDNYKLYMTEYINILTSELDNKKYQYKECLRRNSTIPSVNREYCGNDPEIELGIIKDNFDIWKIANKR